MKYVLQIKQFAYWLYHTDYKKFNKSVLKMISTEWSENSQKLGKQTASHSKIINISLYKNFKFIIKSVRIWIYFAELIKQMQAFWCRWTYDKQK